MDETIRLANKNMTMKIRMGKKIYVINRTYREPTCNYPYTINDIIAVNSSPKLQQYFPELVINDLSFTPLHI